MSVLLLLTLQGKKVIININGETVARYSYDAWGKCTVEFDSTGYIADINPFRYRGYYLDKETNLYYLNSRYYDANTGRFINADSPEYVSIQGGNLFAYCGNCPTKNADYLGFCYTPTYPESYVPNNSGSSVINYSSSNSFKIKLGIGKVTVKMNWLTSLIVGVILLIIRLFLFYKGMFDIQAFLKYLPASVAVIIAFYIPLNAISELISVVCMITNISFVVTTIISIVSSIITGGIGGSIIAILKFLFIEMAKVILSSVIPSFYDISIMFDAAANKRGCTYTFKLFGGGTISI